MTPMTQEEEAARLSRLLPHAEVVAAELWKLEPPMPSLWGLASDAQGVVTRIKRRLAAIGEQAAAAAGGAP